MNQPQPEFNPYDGWNLTELAKEMRKVGDELEAAKTHTTLLQKEYDRLRKQIIPNLMDEYDVESQRIKGVGTISKRHDAYCNVVPGAQPQLYQWLQDEGKGDVIKPFVNPSTLKALIKEMFLAGEEIPEAYVNFMPYTYVAITNKGK